MFFSISKLTTALYFLNLGTQFLEKYEKLHGVSVDHYPLNVDFTCSKFLQGARTGAVTHIPRSMLCSYG